MSDEKPRREVEISRLIANAAGVPSDSTALIKLSGLDRAQLDAAGAIEAINKVLAVGKFPHATAFDSGMRRPSQVWITSP